MKCTLCGSERLRLSRIRRADLPRLFLFSYPVRCAACFERMFVNPFAAYEIYRKASARKRAARESRHSHPHAKTNGA
ncbi:MAG: hypothetical protein WBE41_02400 [Terracidiphilus sp.]